MLTTENRSCVWRALPDHHPMGDRDCAVDRAPAPRSCGSPHPAIANIVEADVELTLRNLSKTYPNGVRALHDLTLTIPRGLFGLLGPNGAGKSTLMRTIATLQEPDAGSIRFGDIDALRDKGRLRETLGYLPQEFGVYPHATAEALLDYFAVLKGSPTPRPARRRPHAPAPDESLRRPQGETRRLLGRHATTIRHRRRARRQPASPHRRRTHRGPRPGGARPLPQPAQRARRRRRRHSLDASRRRRARVVQPIGDHRPGPRSCSRPSRSRPSRPSTGACGSASFRRASCRRSNARTR